MSETPETAPKTLTEGIARVRAEQPSLSGVAARRIAQKRWKLPSTPVAKPKKA